MAIDITQLVIAIIGICIALVTKFAIPWFKSNTTIKQQNIIQAVVKAVVYAAQQLYTHAEKKEKKQYAMERVKTVLATYNIILSTEEIDTYVEGEIKKIKTELSDTSEW